MVLGEPKGTGSRWNWILHAEPHLDHDNYRQIRLGKKRLLIQR